VICLGAGRPPLAVVLRPPERNPPR